jgi:hypothetical protein
VKLPEAITATPAARARLEAWIRAGRPEVDAQDVPVVACDLEPILRVHLGVLPAPVLWDLALHAVVIATGRNVGGWCISVPAPHRDAIEGQKIIDLTWTPGDNSDTEFFALFAHEVGHAYLEPPAPLVREARPPDKVAEAAEDRRRLLRLGEEWGLGHHLVDAETERELRAAAFARALGAVGVGADDCRQRHFTKFRIGQEAAAASAAGRIQ